MELLGVLGILLLLAIPVMAIAAFVMVLGARDRVRVLEARFASLEQRLVGPAARIALGGLLAAALIIGGEWMRRSERLAGMVSLPTASIPAILTAAGTTVAFAVVYAAYALYEFLVPGTAFVLLGMVAVATLAAALLHGPAPVPGRIDAISSIALSAYLLAAALMVGRSGHDGVALATFAVLVAATIAIAWRTEAATAAVPVAAVLVMYVMARWVFDAEID